MLLRPGALASSWRSTAWARFVTLPVEIYNYTKKPLQPKIYALFTLLFAAILIVMVLMNLLQERDAKRSRENRRAFRRGKKVGA